MNDSQDWYSHWWKDSKVFVMQTGIPEPRPGMEEWFEWFWMPIEEMAWSYEAIRRLGKSRAAIKSVERRQIQSMPPFPRLTVKQQDALWLALGGNCSARPPLTTGNNSTAWDAIMPELTIDWDRSALSDIQKFRKTYAKGSAKLALNEIVWVRGLKFQPSNVLGIRPQNRRAKARRRRFCSF